MKKNLVFGLTISVMMLGMIAIVTAPAFATNIRNPPTSEQYVKFNPSTLPTKGTEYVLTISGTAHFVSPAGGFSKHPWNTIGTSRSAPEFLISGDKGGPVGAPVSGEVKVKVSDIYVTAEKGSKHREAQSLLVNPRATAFTVESGNLKIGNTTYTIDNGVATYYNSFVIGMNSRADLTFNIYGEGLAGGIPSMHSVSLVSQPSSWLNIHGNNWLFQGSIYMSES